MLDTLSILSPEISLSDAEKINQNIKKRSCLDMKTGEIEYEVFSGQLEGSYDHRLSVRVHQDKLSQGWHITLEGSVHKQMLGHNIYGGPTDFHKTVSWFVGQASYLLECPLPAYEEWEVRRIDVAECFEMQPIGQTTSYEVCSEFFRGLNNAHYPRRKVMKYDLTGTYFPGSTTTLKFYHKGPEVRKHDYSRLRKVFGDADSLLLLHKANSIIRIEVSIKPKKLKYDFDTKEPVRIGLITDGYLNRLYENEVKKAMREAEDMNTTRCSVNVQKRLFENYSNRKASAMLSTWYMLSTFGEEYCKNRLSRTTLHYHKRDLTASGISWLRTDVMLKDFSIVPSDFVPLLSDSRRLTEVDSRCYSQAM